MRTMIYYTYLCSPHEHIHTNIHRKVTDLSSCTSPAELMPRVYKRLGAWLGEDSLESTTTEGLGACWVAEPLSRILQRGAADVCHSAAGYLPMVFGPRFHCYKRGLRTNVPLSWAGSCHPVSGRALAHHCVVLGSMPSTRNTKTRTQNARGSEHKSQPATELTSLLQQIQA